MAGRVYTIELSLPTQSILPGLGLQVGHKRMG
jgi:hypothetical protein